MGDKKEMQAKIQLDKIEKNFINNLLLMTGDEAYQKYGYKRDETFINTAKFQKLKHVLIFSKKLIIVRLKILIFLYKL